MRKLIGTCALCKCDSVFEVLNIIQQINKIVLAECQCEKCSQRVFVRFEATENNYKPILAKGEESDDHENSPPHATPQTLIP